MADAISQLYGIDSYIKSRLDAGRKPATINRETQLLGQAFRLAHTRRLVHRIPHIRKLPERNVRQGFFAPEEIDAVIAHLVNALECEQLLPLNMSICPQS